MQNQTDRIITALFFSAFSYKRAFLHYVKENKKNIEISSTPWEINYNIQLLRYFYSKYQIQYAIDKTKNYLQKNFNFFFDNVIFFFEPQYSYLLKQIYDPPIVLFYKSSLKNKIDLNDYDTISIVGTRKPISLSLKAVDRIVELFSLMKSSKNLIENLSLINQKQLKIFNNQNAINLTKKIATISGFAKGIDIRAHKASIYFNIPTIAVLGSGIEAISPSENLEIFKGAQANHKEFILISEFFPTYKSGKYTYPLRNRIIVGLSPYLFVIQSGEKSGALISADYAIQENREIFCFDHPTFNNTLLNNGNKKLIEEGANILQIDL